jgi:Thrombospondin type 3 repeat
MGRNLGLGTRRRKDGRCGGAMTRPILLFIILGSVTLSARNTSKSDVQLTEPKEEWLNKSKPYCSKILVKIPYLRKISISLVLSSAIMLLLLLTTSPLLLFNFLPIQASSNSAASLHTTAPADGTVCPSSTVAKLVFDAQGTYSPPYREFTNIGGSFQIYSDAGGNFSMLYTGHINGAEFTPSTAGWLLELDGVLEGVYNNTTCVPKGSYQIQIVTPCGNPAPITINLENKPHLGDFNGRVGCSPPPPQSSMAGSSQDRDGDGISDASDNCPNTPHLRCFREAT